MGHRCRVGKTAPASHLCTNKNHITARALPITAPATTCMHGMGLSGCKCLLPAICWASKAQEHPIGGDVQSPCDRSLLKSSLATNHICKRLWVQDVYSGKPC